MLLNGHWQHIPYEEGDQPLHTAENGYCCGDPECVCADVEESPDGPMPIFLPSTPEALTDLRQARGH